MGTVSDGQSNITNDQSTSSKTFNWYFKLKFSIAQPFWASNTQQRNPSSSVNHSFKQSVLHSQLTITLWITAKPYINHIHNHTDAIRAFSRISLLFLKNRKRCRTYQCFNSRWRVRIDGWFEQQRVAKRFSGHQCWIEKQTFWQHT